MAHEVMEVAGRAYETDRIAPTPARRPATNVRTRGRVALRVEESSCE
jgi:hypothetical protein